jgi:hypothetical protein
MLKKNIILIAFLGGMASMVSASLNWEFGGTTLGSGYTNGWLVSMYKDVNNDTSLSSLIIYNDGTLSSSDDVSASITTTVKEYEGNFYWQRYNIATPGQFHAYSVVFNATNFASASKYLVVDSATVLLSRTDDIYNDTYSIASNSGTWKNIQAIPEPTTLLLFAIGGAGAWIVRRKQTISM